VIKSSGSRRGWRGGRRIALVVGLSVVGAAVLGSAGTASAATVACKGKIVPLNPGNPGLDAEFEMQCSEELRGFSVITNKTFDFFGTETEVTKPGGIPAQQSATIQCTGNVPGPGFGCGTVNRNTPSNCEAVGTSGTSPNQFNTYGPPCTNRIDGNDTVAVQIGFPQNPCKPTGQYAPGKDKLRIWATALTEPLVGSFASGGNFPTQGNTSYTRGSFSSEPFRINTKAYTKCGNGGGGESKGKKTAATSAGVDGGLPRIW
jgi:hypothetical protein